MYQKSLGDVRWEGCGRPWQDYSGPDPGDLGGSGWPGEVYSIRAKAGKGIRVPTHSQLLTA